MEEVREEIQVTENSTENSPFSPFYEPDRKQKKNNGITIALIGILLLLLIAGVIFAVSKLVEAAMGEATTAWDESTRVVSEFWDEVKEEWNSRTEAEADVPDNNGIVEWPEDVPVPFPDEILPDEIQPDDFYYEDGKYIPRPEDEYYLKLANAVREDLSYSIEWEEYTTTDYEDIVEISIQYARVSGDIPAIDEINGYLEDGAMYYATYFDSISATNLWLNVTSYITYMDEEKLSVVVDERFIYEDEQYYNLYCMNFDLVTGSLLYNTAIIEVSEELAEAFREQSDYQNGVSTGVSRYSDEEIMELLADEESLILYYSPVGLEIGYNYPTGWITATFKEYEKFLQTI